MIGNVNAAAWTLRKKYGEIGKKFIHVHHIKSLSEIGKKWSGGPFFQAVIIDVKNYFFVNIFLLILSFFGYPNVCGALFGKVNSHINDCRCIIIK